MAFVSETIPKWLYKRDNNGSIAGYASQKFNKIKVELLAQHSLNLNVTPLKEMKQNGTLPDYCHYDIAGTFNEYTNQFEYNNDFYRIWVYKLGYAFTFLVSRPD